MSDVVHTLRPVVPGAPVERHYPCGVPRFAGERSTSLMDRVTCQGCRDALRYEPITYDPSDGSAKGGAGMTFRAFQPDCRCDWTYGQNCRSCCNAYVKWRAVRGKEPPRPATKALLIAEMNMGYPK